MTTACIFDLDNCLAAASEVGEELYQPAFDAIREANHGTLSPDALARAFHDCWRHPLDWVAAQHGFSDEMLAAGWKVFAHLEIQKPMQGYGDLHLLREVPVPQFLVTSGFRRLQESKVRALNVASCFAAIHVDAIDEPGRKGKQGLFAMIANDFKLEPAQVVVVGDNPDSEIQAGTRLGMRTVQILRPGVPRGDNAGHYIRNLTELLPLL